MYADDMDMAEVREWLKELSAQLAGDPTNEQLLNDWEDVQTRYLELGGR